MPWRFPDAGGGGDLDLAGIEREDIPDAGGGGDLGLAGIEREDTVLGGWRWRGGGVRVPGIERIKGEDNIPDGDASIPEYTPSRIAKGEDNIPSGGDAVVDMSDGWRWRAGGGKAENRTGL